MNRIAVAYECMIGGWQARGFQIYFLHNSFTVHLLNAQDWGGASSPPSTCNWSHVYGYYVDKVENRSTLSNTS